MAELGGSSFFRSVKDWNKIPIEGALYEHAKTMYQEGRTYSPGSVNTCN